ncbi:MAG: serine hydrolase [bacterium]
MKTKQIIRCLLIVSLCCSAVPCSYPDDFLSNHRWQYFISKLNSNIQQFSGKVAIVVKDLNNDQTYSFNADKPFVSASLIKLPIMVAVFKEFVESNISLTQKFKLEDTYRVGGSGILKYKPSGSEYTIYELSYIMIKESDNTAARMLTEIVGYERMNQIFKSIGLKDTNISPKSFDLTNGEIAGDSYTTARDISLLLTEIYNEKMFRRYLSQQMLAILKLPSRKKRLRKYLPENFELAHKTGLLRGACHDAGIVFSPHGNYLICVLTNNHGNYTQAKNFISDVGKLTFDQLKKS